MSAVVLATVMTLIVAACVGLVLLFVRFVLWIQDRTSELTSWVVFGAIMAVGTWALFYLVLRP